MSQDKGSEVWNSAGIKYDTVSKHIADAVHHCIIRLDVDQGDKVLDICTGTGWTSRQLAKSGIDVIGIDFAPDLLTAAIEISKQEHLSCKFELTSAEELPFDNDNFDKIISTFGIMFCQNPQKAVYEMSRVCKPGGRAVLAVWASDGTVLDNFNIIKKYQSVSTNPQSFSPFFWGDKNWVKGILSPYFDIAFESGVSIYYASTPQTAWQMLSSCYGPILALKESLSNSPRLGELEQDFVDYYASYKTELGVALPREYLIIECIKKLR